MKIFSIAFVLVLLLSIGLVGSASAEDCADNTIEAANIYVGTADCVDDVADGAVYGDPTYANDLLVMKYTDDWPNEGSWINNNWNGMGPEGSGETWHYKIDQSNQCAGGGTPDDGGYCIWGGYEMTQSHGTAGGEHIWDVNATGNGYGRDR
jgi:hypothetical protein